MVTSPHKPTRGRRATPSSGRPRRAVVYLRIGKSAAARTSPSAPTSQDRRRPLDRYLDLGLQEAICDKAAARLGATVVGTYFDVGASAADLARPGYQRLLKYGTPQIDRRS